MSLDVTALLQAIDLSDGAADPRESDVFADLNREIDKLTSLSTSGQPDWTRVEQLGGAYLQTQSKDFLVASWLSEAWTQRHAMMGVAAGLALFAGLTETFWETAVPSVQRLRGRRNAISWWLDRLQPWLEQNAEITVGAELSERMLSSIRQLDRLLSDKDPEAPSLSRLMGLLQRIPVDAPSVPSPQSAPAALTGTPSVPGPSQLVEPVTGASGPAVSAPVEAPTTTSSGTNRQAADEVQTAPVPSAVAPIRSVGSNGPVEVRSHDDLIALLKPIQDQVALIGTALQQFDHAHPLSIHLSRFAARVGLIDMPGANQGQSVIAPPPVAILDAFEKVTASKNPQALVEFCEVRIRAFPFWFDLDFHSARGYAMMGAAGSKMREAITESLLSFVKRLPGIEGYSFSNGTPFASSETQAWIRQCQAEQQGDAPADAFGQAQAQARSLQVEGNTEAAVAALQNFISACRSRRDRFRAQLALLDLLLAEPARADLQPLLDPLAEECLRLDLNQWEPELASQLWIKKYQAARQVWLSQDAEFDSSRRDAARRQMESALAQLSVVDFSAVAQLVR